MPRFKQPLQGLSRLSDRVGGGGDPTPRIVWYGQSTSASALSVPSVLAGDIVLAFVGRNSATPAGVPSGFTSISTATGSGASGTVSVVASYLAVAADTSSLSLSGTNQTNLGAVVLRGSAGIGATNKHEGTVNSTQISVPALSGSKANSRFIVGTWDDVITRAERVPAAAIDATPIMLNTSTVAIVNGVQDTESFVIYQPNGPRVAIVVEVLAK